MTVQIQLRHDTAANWTSANPTLAAGEVGLETDTGKAKIGTGATAWASLAYSSLGLPLALTGAVSATRYVGGTASVAPTTGTFAVGDFVITQAGAIYICTVAGTPGTWVAVSGADTLPVTIIDAKGDLIAGTAADTAARLAVAANGSSLRAASGQTTGLEWQLNNLAAAVAPTVNEDSGDGYSVGSRWIDTTADKEYVALDVTVGAAAWKETTAAGGGATSPLVGASGGGAAGGSVAFTDGVVNNAGDVILTGGTDNNASPGGIIRVYGGQTGAPAGEIHLLPYGGGYDVWLKLFGVTGNYTASLSGRGITLDASRNGNDATGKLVAKTNNSVGAAAQILGSDGSGNVVWQTPTIRIAAGVPSGAPGVGELPIALDTTASTGGVYGWSGSAWVKAGP